ncbi:MAG: hypothetical protein KAR43_10180, partial [Deltaproteobacteria bacterium]|nr:hypothetical protein [Deltaproteobacteria bacterium]
PCKPPHPIHPLVLLVIRYWLLVIRDFETEKIGAYSCHWLFIIRLRCSFRISQNGCVVHPSIIGS